LGLDQGTIGDRGEAREAQPGAGARALLYYIRSSGSTPTTRTPGVELYHETDAGEQTTAANTHDDDLNRLKVLQNFQADGPLAGDYAGMVESLPLH
jgi:hypothetical protein